MSRDAEFLLKPGPLPWRVGCVKRNARNGVIYDAEGRLVCVAAIGNAREIVRMANHFAGCKSANILNAGQHPGVVSCASYDPAGGARNSASTILKRGQPCAS